MGGNFYILIFLFFEEGIAQTLTKLTGKLTH